MVERFSISSEIPDFSLLLSKVNPKYLVKIQIFGGKGIAVIGRCFYGKSPV